MPVTQCQWKFSIRDSISFRMDEGTTVSGFAVVAKLEVVASEPADDAVVAAVRAGDEAAFELLFERHRRMVTRLAYRFFYQREQVEDIVQESFAAAYFALGAYRGGQQRSFSSWLSRITVRICYDALRRARPGESSMSDLNERGVSLADTLQDPARENDIEGSAIARDLAEKLLARLEPEDRLVLTMLNVADLSIAETAELTGWSVSKVKMRALRARTALRRVLHRFL